VSAERSIPVVAYGLGPIGLRLAGRVARDLSPAATLVGAVDIDPEQVGKDLGTVLGTNELGVKVTPTLDFGPAEGDRGRGVVLHATGSRLIDVVPQLLTAVELGWNVVSTCEELSFPAIADATIAKELNDRAQAIGVTVVGTGINPGFLMDTLPMVLTTVCTEVTRIEVRRVVNTDHRRRPLQQKVGVGMKAAEFEQLADQGKIGHVGLVQSAHLLANRLGWEVLSYRDEIKPVLTEQAVQTTLGPVRAGGVIGQRQWAEATCADGRGIRFDLEMSYGAPDSDEIRITGSPNLHQQMEGGVNGDAGTEAVVTNLLPVVSQAPPGLLDMADVSRIAWFSGTSHRNGNR
jgi:hypothetical protein